MQVLINYCFIVKNTIGLDTRISTIKMERITKSYTYPVYLNGRTVLAQDSEDLFPENSIILPPQDTVVVQESQDFIDTNCMSFQSQDIVVQESQELIDTNCMSLPPQETIELSANSLELVTTDPLEGTSGKKL